MPSANKKNAILVRWERTLAEGPDRIAVLDPGGQSRRTFAEIEHETRELEERLSDFEPGRVAAFQIGNSFAWPAALLATFRRGLIPLPLGTHMEKGDLESALRATGASLILTEMHDSVRLERLPDGRRFEAEADFLKLTSGTTSVPRAIRFLANQLVADCDSICDTMGFDADDVNFGVIPFSHSYGFSNLLTPLLCRGVPLVASHDRMPRAIMTGLHASGATVFPGMPVFYQAICGLERAEPLPKLRLCISAGAPLPIPVAEAFTMKFGLKIHTFYGASECGGITFDRQNTPRYEQGLVGTAMEGVSLTLRQARGSCSRIEVRSAAVGEGYFPDDDENLKAGCFVPGDLVREEANRLYLAGRVSDIINVAGRKLNPLEVESHLAGMAGVEQVVVFGVASSARHEAPIACVVLGSHRDADSLERECRETMSPWQIPRDFWVVDKVPVNERGKISRRDLATAYSRHLRGTESAS